MFEIGPCQSPLAQLPIRGKNTRARARELMNRDTDTSTKRKHMTETRLLLISHVEKEECTDGRMFLDRNSG